MRLNVHMFRPEDLLATLNCQLLYRIHMLAAAVIPLPRIAFRVFVRSSRSLERLTRRDSQSFPTRSKEVCRAGAFSSASIAA